MRTVSVPGARTAPPRSKRLLALASDERLVERIRAGDELAFEVAFERHSPAILSFCRHMLRSREEGEDALQHTFAAAYRDLRGGDRAIRLKPWLFTIARNRCLSMLRARREYPADGHEIATTGLAEQVERRAELRDLLRDLDDLPEQQREALLLSEVSGLPQRDVAEVLGVGPHKVKALVFRARSGLIERREARDMPCAEIREQLANLRGGSLRRAGLRHHLRVCPGCREYRERVKAQRRMLAALLPAVPSPGLKDSVLAAIGLGGGAGGGGAALGGLGAAASGQAALAKLAIVGALATGGVVAGDAVVTRSDRDRASKPPPTSRAEGATAGPPAPSARPVEAALRTPPAAPRPAAPRPKRGGAGGKRAAKRGKRANDGRGAPSSRGRSATGPHGKALGHAKHPAKHAKPVKPAKPAKPPKSGGNGDGKVREVKIKVAKPPKQSTPAKAGKDKQ